MNSSTIFLRGTQEDFRDHTEGPAQTVLVATIWMTVRTHSWYLLMSVADPNGLFTSVPCPSTLRLLSNASTV